MDGLGAKLSPSFSVLSLTPEDHGLTGWRLLDRMRDAFTAMRAITLAPVELPIVTGVDGALDVLSLRPELAQLHGQSTAHEIAEFIELCRQFDVVPVVPWIPGTPVPAARRCVLSVQAALEPDAAATANREGVAFRIQSDKFDSQPHAGLEGCLEVVFSPDTPSSAGGVWRTTDEHRLWLNCLDERDCVG
jgi:hypothetical protein